MVGEVVIYPNPVSYAFTLQSDEVIETLEIYSSVGKLIKQLTLNTAKITIDISDLSSGGYLVKAVSKNGFFSKQLFVK